MAMDVQDGTRVDASTTAVQSLLRTLDDAAEWQDRAAGRVRAFARSRLVVADEAAVDDDLGARHERRAV